MSGPLTHVVVPIVVAAALPFVSTAIAKIGAFRARDNHETRSWQASLTGWRQRAHWAHLNALETFPIFAVATVLAHLRAPGSETAAMAAYAYCAIRVVYLGVFLADMARLRSLVWFASMGATGVLFWIAAG